MPAKPTSDASTPTHPTPCEWADDPVRTLVLRIAALALTGLPMPPLLSFHARSGNADLAFACVEDLHLWAHALGARDDVTVFPYRRDSDGAAEQVISTTAYVSVGSGATICLSHWHSEPIADDPQTDDPPTAHDATGTAS